MERLKNMKEILVGQVCAQLGNIKDADCEELGAAIDMIKDLEEAMYYCTITKAMEEKDEEKHQPVYYTERYTPSNYYRDMDRDGGRMYYSDSGSGSRGGNSSNAGNGSRSGSSWYTERDYPSNWRDENEGRSPMKRKMYMESKQMHKDKTTTLRDLEEYAQELTSDVIEMIKDATPEEKAMLQKKMTTLATKIV